MSLRDIVNRCLSRLDERILPSSLLKIDNKQMMIDDDIKKGKKKMNEMIMHDPFMPFSNMFRNLEAMMDFDFNKESRGLRKYLKRPHNLITKKDKDGKIQSYQIEMVHTPFKKDEVKVEVLDGMLTVNCGSENKVKDEDMDYCGISHQSYSFSIPLSDAIDVNAITAKAEDGILTIDLPVKQVEEVKPAPLAIEVK